MSYSKDTSPEELIDMFKFFDRDGDNLITVEELDQAAMRAKGKKLTERELQEMLDVADIDHDGTVSFSEFVTMMTAKITKKS